MSRIAARGYFSCIACPQSTHFPGGGVLMCKGGMGASPARENLKTLILSTEVLCFTEESFRKEESSRMASWGARA